MKQALIIFVRKPELGKVKTRLAATVGNEKALTIYKELLQHTFNITQNIQADKFVFYHEQIDVHDMWRAEGFSKKLQLNTDNLGEKMEAAFKEIFTAGYTNTLIVGSDCLQLQPQIIETAFKALLENDIVIGPAFDGGYYLLGMNTLHNFIFKNKSWSTAAVLNETLADIKKHDLDVILLPVLTDVDTQEDWLKSKQTL